MPFYLRGKIVFKNCDCSEKISTATDNETKFTTDDDVASFAFSAMGKNIASDTFTAITAYNCITSKGYNVDLST